MLSTRGIAVGLLATAVSFGAARAALAQNEAALKSYFEGRRVTVRIDMPGSSDGVDVRFVRADIDFDHYRRDLKRYGIAIRAGDSTTVTLLKVKKDLIEFQLGGGGYGTFWDDTSTSVYIPRIEKSEHEKDLEKRVKEENDSHEKRRLQRELDDVRERRERENQRIEAERDRASAVKAEHVAQERLRGGSRFNLRYDGAVPADVRPEQVIAALREYLDFGTADDRPPADDSTPVADPAMLRKGMLRGDVERAFGRPDEVSTRREGNLAITTVFFVSADQRIAVEFVDDVLVRYTITSK